MTVTAANGATPTRPDPDPDPAPARTPTRTPTRPRLRDRVRDRLPTSIPWLTAAWSAGYAALAAAWAAGHGSYPFGSGDPKGLGSLLHGTGPTPASGVIAACCAVGAAVAVALALPGTGRLTRRILLAVAVLAASALALLPDHRLLALLGYAPILLIGAPFGWPPEGVGKVITWPEVNQLLCAVGSVLWAGTALITVRRAKDRCPACGRGDDLDHWTGPDRARRWGRWATGVAVAVPLLYAVDRIGWVLGFSFGASDQMVQEVRNGKMVWAALGLGLGALNGAVLTLGLVQRWGEVFPRWIPVLRGRRVPPALAIVPASVVAAAVLVASISLDRMLLTNDLPDFGFAAFVPMIPWPLWAGGLGAATLAYHYRRRGQCRRCHRG